MRVKEVQYGRLKNLGDYEHEKLSVVVEVEPTEDPHDAVMRAKDFVAAQLDRPPHVPDYRLREAQAIVSAAEQQDGILF